METPEAELQTFYEAHRDETAVFFYDRLIEAKLESYVRAPREPTVAAVSKAVANYITALVTRSPETYVDAQKAAFERRVAAGVLVIRDILGGLDAAEATSSWVIDRALGHRPSDQALLRRRASQYLLMTRTMLTEMITALKRSPPQ